MITCKEATLFILQNEEKKISFGDKARLRLHLLICKFCRMFQKQSLFLDAAVKNLSNQTRLSESEKLEMERKLKDSENF